MGFNILHGFQRFLRDSTEITVGDVSDIGGVLGDCDGDEGEGGQGAEEGWELHDMRKRWAVETDTSVATYMDHQRRRGASRYIIRRFVYLDSAVVAGSSTLSFGLGEWILVTAAAGGVGMSAVQIADGRGASYINPADL